MVKEWLRARPRPQYSERQYHGRYPGFPQYCTLIDRTPVDPSKGVQNCEFLGFREIPKNAVFGKQQKSLWNYPTKITKMLKIAIFRVLRVFPVGPGFWHFGMNFQDFQDFQDSRKTRKTQKSVWDYPRKMPKTEFYGKSHSDSQKPEKTLKTRKNSKKPGKTGVSGQNRQKTVKIGGFRPKSSKIVEKRSKNGGSGRKMVKKWSKNDKKFPKNR